ncbi:hypothetical protein MRX96_042044 [Rhipicephalus microplus]
MLGKECYPNSQLRNTRKKWGGADVGGIVRKEPAAAHTRLKGARERKSLLHIRGCKGGWGLDVVAVVILIVRNANERNEKGGSYDGGDANHPSRTSSTPLGGKETIRRSSRGAPSSITLSFLLSSAEFLARDVSTLPPNFFPANASSPEHASAFILHGPTPARYLSFNDRHFLRFFFSSIPSLASLFGFFPIHLSFLPFSRSTRRFKSLGRCR